MITIPKQHYVGFKLHTGGDSLPLGFATPYAEDKAFEKRKHTIHSWVASNAGYAVDDEGTLVRDDEGRAVRNEPPPCEIVDNVLSSGFRIARDIRRVYWGGGNVVWRVEDPRGFELEISSSNLARILDCATIENGVILGNCIWGRDGAHNVLLPEASEPYQEAVAATKRVDAPKISVRDIPLGSTVQLKDGTVGKYLGNLHYVEGKYGDKFFVPKRSYVVLADDQLIIKSRLEVVTVVEQIAAPMTLTEAASLATTGTKIFKERGPAIYRTYSAVAFADDITFALRPVDPFVDGVDRRSSRHSNVLVKWDGRYVECFNERDYDEIHRRSENAKQRALAARHADMWPRPSHNIHVSAIPDGHVPICTVAYDYIVQSRVALQRRSVVEYVGPSYGRHHRFESAPLSELVACEWVETVVVHNGVEYPFVVDSHYNRTLY